MPATTEGRTEQFVLESLGYKLGQNDKVWVEDQGNVSNVEIAELLIKAGGKPADCELSDFSKGGAGKAKPEFIITKLGRTDLIIVIECKKDRKHHETVNWNKPRGYAVDGALYYAKYLKENFNVIALGVSGDEGESRISTFVWYKGAENPEQKPWDDLMKFEEYEKHFDNQSLRCITTKKEVRAFAMQMHDDLREVGAGEKEKPLIVAGIMIALSDQDYQKTYKVIADSKVLVDETYNTIKRVLEGTNISSAKVNILKDEFKVIKKIEKFKTTPLNRPRSLFKFIDGIFKNIYPHVEKGLSLDIIGEFYSEFVKYSGGDGSGLGIVLTPNHITELFADLAEVGVNDTILDICCGTGAFLVSSMATMFSKAKSESDIERIKNNGFYGIEIRYDLFALACANMIVRGDGKSNLMQGDCFSSQVTNQVSGKSNKGMINPPYSQSTPELKFVKRMLDLLQVGGTGLAIVPMSCAIGTKFKEERKDLMANHRLLAVMTMADDLFSGSASSNTCIMVWKAHEPHDKTVHETWFGYWKDDGFVKSKSLGRIDAKDKWEKIKSEWLKAYRSKDVVDGKSAKAYVGHDDEWLCEAYMVTDYSVLNQKKFEKAIGNFCAYLVANRRD